MKLTVKVCPVSGDKFFFDDEGCVVRVESRDGNAVVLDNRFEGFVRSRRELLVGHAQQRSEFAPPQADSIRARYENLRSEGLSLETCVDEGVRRNERGAASDAFIKHVIRISGLIGRVNKNRSKRVGMKHIVRRNQLFLIINRHFKHYKRRVAVPDGLK